VICVQDKTCTFFLPLSVITQVINVLNGIWRHHLLSNKVRHNSCPLILDNNHSKFSVICVRFMYTSTFFSFFYNPTPFVFFKDIFCFTVHVYARTVLELLMGCWNQNKARRRPHYRNRGYKTNIKMHVHL